MKYSLLNFGDRFTIRNMPLIYRKVNNDKAVGEYFGDTILMHGDKEVKKIIEQGLTSNMSDNNTAIQKTNEAIGEFVSSTGCYPSVILLSNDFYYSEPFRELLVSLYKEHPEGISEFKICGCKARIISPLITDCKEIEVY